jgi:2,3-bisphosphoglycerate-dependent phosphoglycerate mutase
LRLFLLARHGESLLNVAGLVNADPSRDRGLSPRGEEEARELGRQLAGISIDLVVTSRFPRTYETATLALGGRDVPRVVVPELDDVRVGQLEGKTIAEYRAWKRDRPRSDPFPGGESLDDAAARYADAYRLLLGRPEPIVLVVSHEIPVRYAINAAAGSDQLDRPVHDVRNAVPYLFDERGLGAAAAGIARLSPSVV